MSNHLLGRDLKRGSTDQKAVGSPTHSTGKYIRLLHKLMYVNVKTVLVTKSHKEIISYCTLKIKNK